jgi:hypothetical protein
MKSLKAIEFELLKDAKDVLQMVWNKFGGIGKSGQYKIAMAL